MIDLFDSFELGYAVFARVTLKKKACRGPVTSLNLDLYVRLCFSYTCGYMVADLFMERSYIVNNYGAIILITQKNLYVNFLFKRSS